MPPRAMVQTTFRMEPATYEQAQEVAKQAGVSLNVWINRVVKEAIAQAKAPQEPFVEGRPANWESLSEDESPPLGTTWAEWARRRAGRNG